MQKLSVITVARLCHELNREWCDSCGDASQLTWNNAAPWQRESAIRGVQHVLDNPDDDDASQHDAWMRDKLAAGWTHGPVKDEVAKTHPCLVPYAELPEEQRIKDTLFRGLVKLLQPYIRREFASGT
jgi:hypothetical protein